jgi:hypothetical protein
MLKRARNEFLFMGWKGAAATLVEKLNIAAGHPLVAAWAILPPAVAFVEKAHVGGVVACAYGIILGAVASRRYEQYGEVNDRISKSGYGGLDFTAEVRRLARIHAERNDRLPEYNEALRQYLLAEEQRSFYD